jgi:hypothetical protein
MQRNFLQEKKNTIKLLSFLRKRPKESNTLENSEKLEKGNNLVKRDKDFKNDEEIKNQN